MSQYEPTLCKQCQYIIPSTNKQCKNLASCRSWSDSCGARYCHLHRIKVRECGGNIPPSSSRKSNWLNAAARGNEGYNDCITNHHGTMYSKSRDACYGDTHAYSLYPDETSDPRHIVWDRGDKKSVFTDKYRWANYSDEHVPATMRSVGNLVCDDDNVCVRIPTDASGSLETRFANIAAEEERRVANAAEVTDAEMLDLDKRLKRLRENSPKGHVPRDPNELYKTYKYYYFQIWEWASKGLWEQFENNHDFIQVIFPTTYIWEVGGANPHFDLTEEEIASLANLPQFKDDMRTMFAVMMLFYGLTRDGKIVDKDRYSKYFCRGGEDESFPHNHWRITRMLKSLKLFGMKEEFQILKSVTNSVMDTCGNKMDWGALNHWNNVNL